jgi:hypothetical protein
MGIEGGGWLTDYKDFSMFDFKKLLSRIVPLTLLIPSCGFGQSLGYLDADTLNEAVAMIIVTNQTAETMRVRCIVHDKTLKDGIDADLLKWRNTERQVLGKAINYWNRAVEKDPRQQGVLVQSERLIEANFKSLSEMSASSGREVMRQFCIQHFSDLASGIWRARTPRAYEYIDKAP